MQKIAIIGAGNMGGAVALGLHRFAGNNRMFLSRSISIFSIVMRKPYS